MTRDRQRTALWRRTSCSTASAPAEESALRPAAAANVPARRPLFRQEVIAFQQQNRQWGRVVPLQPLSTQLMVWSVISAAAAIIAFLFVAQYARKETATGYLAPAAGSARVFAQQPGTVSAVFVQQGDSVRKGQPLLAVVTGQFAANGEDVNASVLETLNKLKQGLISQIQEETTRTASEQERLAAQIREHEAVLAQLDAQTGVQRQRIAIMQKSFEAGAQLRPQGLVSDVDQRHREEALLDQQQGMITLLQQMTTRRGQLAEARFNLEQLPAVQGEKIQSLRNELSSAEQRIAEVNGRSAYIVRAPIGGRVSLLQASEGQPADPRRMQLEILPADSPLQAELFIPARAIGFVEVGQDVRLLFDAFPYQRFGTYHGKIVKVSQTVLLDSDVSGPVKLQEPAYAATVALDRPDITTAHGKTIPLQPDMSLRADIILEKRTLVDWILGPLKHLGIEG
jgi:membrane fusion protein